jgi:quaternary ammonium compound-resistance protein SugE
MAWVNLLIAGIFEVVWAIGIKYTNGFTKIYPTIITITGMIVSFYFLSIAIKTLPIGTAYAVWTGIGTIGVVIVGMIWFNEPKDFMRIIFLILILIGIMGLKLTTKDS